MDKETKVSVIIPVYNVEKYLEECLKSVINQSLTEIEIICIDDGSKDGSMKILNELSKLDHRIKVFQKENGGLSSTRNMGLRKAIGKYILFLDSDDWIEPETLNELYKIAVENNLDNIFFNAEVFFDSELIKKEENGYINYYKRKEAYIGIYGGQEFCREIMKNGDFRPSACLQMPKREFLIGNHIDFYEGIIHEDNLFTIQSLLLEDRVMFIDKTFYRRRIRENSIVTTEKGINNAIGYFIFSKELSRFTDKFKLEEALYFEIENYIAWTLQRAMSCIEDYTREQIMTTLGKYSNDIKLPFMLYIYRESIERKKLRQEIENYKYSNSYKAGRVITYVPRKMIMVIKYVFHKLGRKSI